MTLIRKMAAPAAAFAVAALLFGALATSAQAQTPPFSAYGIGQTPGAVVEAFVGGNSCGTATADADGNWLLEIAADAPCTPAAGDEISFTLDGAAVTETATWSAGGVPADVANGISLTPSGDGGSGDGGSGDGGTTPPPADTGNAGLAATSGSSLLLVLALMGLATALVGGARVSTRSR